MAGVDAIDSPPASFKDHNQQLPSYLLLCSEYFYHAFMTLIVVNGAVKLMTLPPHIAPALLEVFIRFYQKTQPYMSACRGTEVLVETECKRSATLKTILSCAACELLGVPITESEQVFAGALVAKMYAEKVLKGLIYVALNTRPWAARYLKSEDPDCLEDYRIGYTACVHSITETRVPRKYKPVESLPLLKSARTDLNISASQRLMTRLLRAVPVYGSDIDRALRSLMLQGSYDPTGKLRTAVTFEDKATLICAHLYKSTLVKYNSFCAVARPNGPLFSDADMEERKDECHGDFKVYICIDCGKIHLDEKCIIDSHRAVFDEEGRVQPIILPKTTSSKRKGTQCSQEFDTFGVTNQVILNLSSMQCCCKKTYVLRSDPNLAPVPPSFYRAHRGQVFDDSALAPMAARSTRQSQAQPIIPHTLTGLACVDLNRFNLYQNSVCFSLFRSTGVSGVCVVKYLPRV